MEGFPLWLFLKQAVRAGCLRRLRGFLAVVIMLMVIGLSPCLRRNHLEGWTGVASLTVNLDKKNCVIYFYLLVND